jgi:hypothetical protein
MKKIFFAGILLLAVVVGRSQTNLSGVYGYSFKPEGSPPKGEEDKGPAGKLVLLQMDGNKYRFWLDVTLGWPYYHVGETDGTISFVNDTASFDNTFEEAASPCILKFKWTQSTIHINSMSTSFSCGFGNGVNADGEYTMLKVQPALNNNWLKTEYPQSPELIVVPDKAEIFKDENCVYSFVPKKYLSKGDSLMNIAETEKSIYTEYIDSFGKFVYGWIKRSAIKIKGTK